jgi:branched-chain amino acid transport system substrate-binding protein
MSENMQGTDLSDSSNVAGYSFAQTLEQVLRRCGDDLSREKHHTPSSKPTRFSAADAAAGQSDNTSPTDYRVITLMKLQQFNGRSSDFLP